MDSREYFRGMFGGFADSLPDSWGELLLDRILLKNGIRREEIGSLDRLAYVGSSGMGALEYYPSKNSDFSFDGIDYDMIAKNVIRFFLQSLLINWTCYIIWEVQAVEPDRRF